MNTFNINRPVNVTRLRFGRDMRAYPQAIEHEGSTYEFVDRGLSCTVSRGESRTHILTLTDGTLAPDEKPTPEMLASANTRVLPPANRDNQGPSPCPCHPSEPRPDG